jgi:hypothetical protein
MCGLAICGFVAEAVPRWSVRSLNDDGDTDTWSARATLAGFGAAVFATAGGAAGAAEAAASESGCAD